MTIVDWPQFILGITLFALGAGMLVRCWGDWRR